MTFSKRVRHCDMLSRRYVVARLMMWRRKGLVAEFHELRTVMSAAALLMQSFGLPQFAGLPDVRSLDVETDEGSIDVLEGADADLSSAFAHLNQAAAGLTAAKQKLDTLR